MPPFPPPGKKIKHLKICPHDELHIVGSKLCWNWLEISSIIFSHTRNSTTKRLLCNSLKGKSRQNQFFLQHKSWMYNWLQVEFVYLYCINSFKKVKRPKSPNESWIGGGSPWQEQYLRYFASFKSSAALSLHTGPCYRSMAFPHWEEGGRVLPYMSHVGTWRSEGCEFEMGKSFCCIGRVRKRV